jgi:TonB-dependent starch-binding outer membrane protein SusC
MQFKALVMNLTVILVVSACLQVSAAAYSQTVTLSKKDVPLETVFKEIRRQTGYSYFCKVEWLQRARNVDIDVKNAPLEQVLDLCFKDQPLTYTIVNKTIMVRPRENKTAEATPPGDKQATPVDIKGRVTNDKGEPLSGASIEIKSSARGTLTDANGMFELKKVDPDALLIISFTGYGTREITIKGNGFIPVSLALSTNSLDETVVIAYGTTTRRFNTGDVSTVKAGDIEKQPVSNPLAALEGRVPGMTIVQNTGVPGGGFTVRIRGQNSIASGNDPLYVIDGVPYSSNLLSGIGSQVLGFNLGNTVGSPLNFINPSDIESIDVLKDADATAIYGSRGANGVVLITTKRGKAGKTSVDINMYQGAGKVAHTLNYLNTPQYLVMRHEAFKNDGATPDPTVDYDLLSWDTTRYTDWQKNLIGGTARYSQAQASISGGNANAQYLIGGGYHRETTVFPGNFSDQKGSVHFNVTGNSPDRKFKAVLAGSYLSDNNHLPNLDLTSYIQYLPPDAPPPYNPDGTLNWANSTWPASNPYSYLFEKYMARTKNLIGHGELGYQLLPGLELKTSLGYTDLQTNENTTFPTASIDPKNRSFIKSNSVFANYDIQSWIIEPQASYGMNLGGGRLNALVGATVQQTTSQGQTMKATGFSSDELLGNIQAASSITASGIINAQYKYSALFGRLNYNWKDKYLLDVTARRDGSSRFGPGKQFAGFGAVGGAWIFSRERFFQQSLPFLSFGKLKASYGTSGNDQIGDYKYLNLYSSTTYPFLGAQGVNPSNLFNPDFAWEINKKLEGGIELGLLKDRILVSAGYYRNRSSNQLIAYALPSITGFTSVTANLPALVQNTGLEFTINTTNIKTADFTWSSSINLSLPRNKLLAFPNLSNSSYSNSYLIGQPLTITRAFHTLGADSASGVYRFADLKGNPTLNPSFTTDRNVIINTAPTFYGGFQNSFQYRGFQLDIFFQFVRQKGVTFLSNYIPGTEGYSQPATVLSRWQKPGDKTNIERFNQDFSLDNAFSDFQLSDGNYGDASFVRLKNLSLSYRLPAAWLQKMHMQNGRFYLQGQNLLTITHYIGYDPERPGSANLPPLRVITAGIQVTL